MSDMLNVDTWKHQWDAFMSAPYIIGTLLFIVLIIAVPSTWWFRGATLRGLITSLREQIVSLKAENAGQKEIFENRRQLAVEKVELAYQAKSDVERQLNDLRAASVGDDAIAPRLAGLKQAIDKASIANNAVVSAAVGVNFPDGISVHRISFYIPELDSKSVLHLYVELFNGTGEDLALSKIDGHIELSQEIAANGVKKRGIMALPTFYEHSQNNVPKNQNFSFKLSQEVHSKFAESWSLGSYVLDFSNLNILVHPIADSTNIARLPLWGAAVIVRDGTAVRASQREYIDGQRKSWPPVS